MSREAEEDLACTRSHTWTAKRRQQSKQRRQAGEIGCLAPRDAPLAQTVEREMQAHRTKPRYEAQALFLSPSIARRWKNWTFVLLLLNFYLLDGKRTDRKEGLRA